MRKKDRSLKERCWVDLFQTSQFAGRMRRILGPCRVENPQAGSLIVGPDARVEVTVVKRGKEDLVNLESNRLATDLATELQGASIVSITVHHREKPRRTPRQTPASPKAG